MAKTDIDLQSAFNLEPKEIVKYFESKNCKISFDWHEVYEDAHAKAFTVAKMTEADLLKDTHKMLTTAIKEGWSEGKFKKNATELFEKKGWVGKKEVINPKTGELQTVELGTPRRIKKIFHCNMTSAYSVGRYKEQMENVDVAPYLQYVAILDNRTRPEHAAMNGKVFRYDDPIWNTMYPPNGWNCRCLVTQLTKGDVRRKNIEVETSDGKIKGVSEVVGDTEKQNTVYTFSKGGNVYHLKPDAGWGTNQALNSSNCDLLLYDKIKNFDYGIKQPLIKELNENPISINQIQSIIRKGIKEIENGTFRPNKQSRTLAWLTPEILKFTEEKKLLNTGAIILFSDKDIVHLLRTKKNEKQKLTFSQVLRMPATFRKPSAIYYDIQDNALIYIQKLQGDEIEEGKDIIKFVVKPTKNSWVLRTAGRIKSEDLKIQRYKKIKDYQWKDSHFPSSDEL